MTPIALVFAATVAAQPAAPSNPLLLPETPNPCESCAGWNRPHAPVHVFGNTWWVGTEGLSAVAIDTGEGVVLLDGALPQSAPLVKANLAAAGLKLSDVKFILNSHAHFDHAGGIAALQRESGASVVVSAWSAKVLRSGCPALDDPQVGFGCAVNGLPRVGGKIRVIRDGETLRLGKVALTAHLTPGHTPGGTTWTWTSCEGSRCLNMVYADSLTPVSAPGFRFTPIAAAMKESIAKISALPCDVLLTAHPDASETVGRLSAASDGGRADPADPGQCRAYAARASVQLKARLAKEREAAKARP